MGCVQRGMVQAGRWARAWRTRAGGALSWTERNKEEQQPGARDVRRAVLVGRRAAGAGPLTVRRTAVAAPGLWGSRQSRRRGRGGANGRASARASKAPRAGPLSSFLFFVRRLLIPLWLAAAPPLRGGGGGVGGGAPTRPPRCLVPATRSSRAHAASSGGGGESRPGAAGRRRRGATGRAPAAGPAECRGRRHGRRRRRRPSQQQHRASSIEHRDDSGQPAGRARAGDSVAAVGADVGPPATGQPVRGTCRRPRRPVTSARVVVVVVLTAPAAAAAGRRHGRASGQASSSPPPPRADGRRSLARAAQPAASCFGPTAERGSETGGPRGQRRRAAAARRRDAGRAVGTGDDSSVTRRRCATRRRPSVAGARARPRTPWSAAGGGTPNRGHISHARSGARPGPSASIIGRERAQSKADSTSSELCLSDGASGGTGPPPPPAGLGIKAKKEVQKRRAACAAPLLKRPGTRRAERRCDPARTPCSTLRTNR